jgi:hypothetical protein
MAFAVAVSMIGSPRERWPSTARCDPSYPDVCIPSASDLDCRDVPYASFRVVGADPHGFDADDDGWCEP